MKPPRTWSTLYHGVLTKAYLDLDNGKKKSVREECNVF